MKRRGVLPAFGFFGGSFDPLQKGHIALALAALRERRLGRVYLVPAARSPLKGNLCSARIARPWFARGFGGWRGLALGSWELNRPGPSYTFQTLRRLRRVFPGRRWAVILGEDSWRNVPPVAALAGNRRPLSLDCRKAGRSGADPGTGGGLFPPGAASSGFLHGRPSLPWCWSFRRSRGARARVGIHQKERPLPLKSQKKKVRFFAAVRKKRGSWKLWRLRCPLPACGILYRWRAGPASWPVSMGRIRDQAVRAGLLHDWAKEWSPARLRGYVRETRGFRSRVESHFRTPTGRAPARYASAHRAGRRGWAGAPATRAAMARHTLGHGRMTLLDKILYVADFLPRTAEPPNPSVFVGWRGGTSREPCARRRVGNSMGGAARWVSIRPRWRCGTRWRRAERDGFPRRGLASRPGGGRRGGGFAPVPGGHPLARGPGHSAGRADFGAVIGTDLAEHAPHSDTLMVWLYRPSEGQLDVLSIPRDTRVDLPGYRF